MARETAKTFQGLKQDNLELPKWAKANAHIKKVVVIEGPVWDGEKFVCPHETLAELKSLNCEILIPVILTAER